MDPFLTQPSVGGANRNLLRLRVVPVSEFSNVASGPGQIIEVAREAEWTVIKRLCVAALTSKERARTMAANRIKVYLLPGGEELYDTKSLREADAVAVYTGPGKLFPHEDAQVAVDSDQGTTEMSAAELNHATTGGTLFVPGTHNSASFKTYKSYKSYKSEKSVQGSSPSLKRHHSKMTFRKAVRKLVLMNRIIKSAGKKDVKYAESEKWNQKLSRSRGGRRRSVARRTMDAYIRDIYNLYAYGKNRPLSRREKLPWHVVHPDSKLKAFWDILIFVLVVYFGFAVPLRLAFSPDEETSASIAIDYVGDVIFLLDLVLNFRVAYREDGVIISSSSRMAIRYLTTWFPLDFIASFPISWVLSGSDAGRVNRLFRVFRMFKLVRLLRLLKMFPRFFEMLEAQISLNPSLLRFLRSFVVMIMIWHFVACAYWFMAVEEYGGVAECPDNPDIQCFVNVCLCGSTNYADRIVLPETDETFYDEFKLNYWIPHASYASRDITDQYFEAYFWAVQVTVGVGDDIDPTNSGEVVFTTIAAIVGLLMYSLIIGSASSALSNIDSTAAARRQTMEKTVAFMRSRKVPAFFQRIIQDYYQHIWSLPDYDVDIFRDLPPALWERLRVVMNRDVIDRLPVLQLLPPEVVTKLLPRLTQSTFLPGEFIVEDSEHGTSMFLIRRGKVDALLPKNNVVFLTLLPGDFFGEEVLVGPPTYNANYRAVDYLDLLRLDRVEYQELELYSRQFTRLISEVCSHRKELRIRAQLEVLRSPFKRGAHRGSMKRVSEDGEVETRGRKWRKKKKKKGESLEEKRRASVTLAIEAMQAKPFSDSRDDGTPGSPGRDKDDSPPTPGRTTTATQALASARNTPRGQRVRPSDAIASFVEDTKQTAADVQSPSSRPPARQSAKRGSASAASSPASPPADGVLTSDGHPFRVPTDHTGSSPRVHRSLPPIEGSSLTSTNPLSARGGEEVGEE